MLTLGNAVLQHPCGYRAHRIALVACRTSSKGRPGLLLACLIHIGSDPSLPMGDAASHWESQQDLQAQHQWCASSQRTPPFILQKVSSGCAWKPRHVCGCYESRSKTRQTNCSNCVIGCSLVFGPILWPVHAAALWLLRCGCYALDMHVRIAHRQLPTQGDFLTNSTTRIITVEGSTVLVLGSPDQASTNCCISPPCLLCSPDRNRC